MDDGSNAEQSRTKDQGCKLDSSTAKQSACNVPANYEADFDEEPLKSVDISHPAVECSEEERQKLKQLLWRLCPMARLTSVAMSRCRTAQRATSQRMWTMHNRKLQPVWTASELLW